MGNSNVQDGASSRRGQWGYQGVGLALLALFAGILSASPVQAQGWLEDRRRTEGPGFRVGNLELHPGVGVEAGYDNNLFLEDQGQNDTALLRTTAHLTASTLGRQRRQEGERKKGQEARAIAFSGGLHASYLHFFTDQVDDNVSGGLGLNLQISPDTPFSVNIYENFERTVRPFADQGPGEISYGRNRNVAGVDFSLSSDGNVLEGKLGYQNRFQIFDDGNFRFADRFTHRVRQQLNWRFFPSTAFIQRTSVSFVEYPNEGTRPTTQVNDSIQVSSTVGLNGALTNTFSAAVRAGYQAGFFEGPGDDFENFRARVEGRWQPRNTIRLAFGYAREARTSIIGNFDRSDRGYLKTHFMFGGAFLLGATASVAYHETGVALAPDGMSRLGSTAERTGIRVEADLFAEYRFTNWLGVNANFGYRADFTDFRFMRPGPMAVIPDPGGEYDQFEVWAGVRAFY